MSDAATTFNLPEYHQFVESIAKLELPISASELHGILCGYLAASSPQSGDMYLRALMHHKKEASMRDAALALFNMYTVSQQQMTSFEFDFQLFLPEEDYSLAQRAQAFSEWCEGFTQGLTLSGVSYQDIEDEETQEAIAHITEFGQLDYEALQVNEDDEKALMEVVEYTRMAVLHIYTGIQAFLGQSGTGGGKVH